MLAHFRDVLFSSSPLGQIVVHPLRTHEPHGSFLSHLSFNLRIHSVMAVLGCLIWPSLRPEWQERTVGTPHRIFRPSLASARCLLRWSLFWMCDEVLQAFQQPSQKIYKPLSVGVVGVEGQAIRRL